MRPAYSRPVGTAIDLTGQTFDRLTVVERTPNPHGRGDVWWLCRCSCGTVKPVNGQLLRSGVVRSCGCLRREMARVKPRRLPGAQPGQRFGMLTVVGKDGDRCRGGLTYWVCRCSCGELTTVYLGNLTRGHTTSCGCIAHEIRAAKRFVDLTGQRFGLLTVHGFGGRRVGQVVWICECDCGGTSIAFAGNLQRGLTKSCGCNSGGLAPDDPAIVYLLRHDAWAAVKVGIAKDDSTRLQNMAYDGWTVMATFRAVGAHARAAERAVLQVWRSKGIGEGVPAELMRFGGHTETAPACLVDLDHAAGIIRAHI